MQRELGGRERVIAKRLCNPRCHLFENIKMENKNSLASGRPYWNLGKASVRQWRQWPIL